MIITSISNPLIKELVKLPKASFRKKREAVVIDGAREIALALAAGWKIQQLFYCPELVKSESRETNHLLKLERENIIEVSEPVFKKICYKEKPEGFLATAKLQQNSLAQIKLPAQPLIVVLEKVEKPGNLGAILRTAYAAGVAAVIVNDNQTDI